MNEYHQQAADFCAKHDVKIDIVKATAQTPPPWAEKKNAEHGIKYSVTITRGNRRPYSFDFWDSILNRELAEDAEVLKRCQWFPEGHPDIIRMLKKYRQRTKKELYKHVKQQLAEADEGRAYSILSCLTKYPPGIFADFCGDYGYDEDSRRAEGIYKAVCEEWFQVESLFGDCLDDLREIQ